jgi:Reverse transcriptase (RNA-dependent DNA polymerase)
MTIPSGHKREGISNLVCRLNKFIYGLEQSPRAWYKKLNQFLASCNFKVSDTTHLYLLDIISMEQP